MTTAMMSMQRLRLIGPVRIMLMMVSGDGEDLGWIVDTDRWSPAVAIRSTSVAVSYAKPCLLPPRSLSCGKSFIVWAAFSRSIRSHGDGLRPFLSNAPIATDRVWCTRSHIGGLGPRKVLKRNGRMSPLTSIIINISSANVSFSCARLSIQYAYYITNSGESRVGEPH